MATRPTPTETILTRRIISVARQMGGGQEGINIGYNDMHDYWAASVAVDRPRRRSRWVMGMGRDISQALRKLEEAVLARRPQPPD